VDFSHSEIAKIALSTHLLKLLRVSLRRCSVLQRQQNNAVDMVAINFHLADKSILTIKPE